MTTAREKIVNVRKDSIVPYRDEMLHKNKDKLKIKEYLHYITDSTDLEYGKGTKETKGTKGTKGTKETKETKGAKGTKRRRDDSNFIYFLLAAYLIIALILFFGGN